MTIILLVIVLICKLLLDAYLKTRSGYLLRAVGDNDVLVTSLAKDKGMSDGKSLPRSLLSVTPLFRNNALTPTDSNGTEDSASHKAMSLPIS